MKFTRHAGDSSWEAGFSLIEILVAVAVMGIMAAIAVPQVVRMTGQAQAGKEMTNAQRLSSTAAAAVAGGVVFRDLESALAALTSEEGVVATAGGLTGTRYRVRRFSAEELEAVKRHLRFADGQLTVVP